MATTQAGIFCHFLLTLKCNTTAKCCVNRHTLKATRHTDRSSEGTVAGDRCADISCICADLASSVRRRRCVYYSYCVPEHASCLISTDDVLIIVSLLFSLCQPCCVQGLRSFLFSARSLSLSLLLDSPHLHIIYWLIDLTPQEWLGELLFLSPSIIVPTVRAYISLRLFAYSSQVHIHTYTHKLSCCKESILCE